MNAPIGNAVDSSSRKQMRRHVVLRFPELFSSSIKRRSLGSRLDMGKKVKNVSPMLQDKCYTDDDFKSKMVHCVIAWDTGCISFSVIGCSIGLTTGMT